MRDRKSGRHGKTAEYDAKRRAAHEAALLTV